MAGELLTVDLLYGDHEGGQLTISRFIFSREEDGHWRPGVVRPWTLEGTDPRGASGGPRYGLVLAATRSAESCVAPGAARLPALLAQFSQALSCWAAE